MITIGEIVYLFGGANRVQTNFDDLWIIRERSDESPAAECVECKGDIPMPRSDHAVVAYGNSYLMLFGGKNYGGGEEGETCYNDLYMLSLESFEWRYVGEAGEEIEARCGHSLGIIEPLRESGGGGEIAYCIVVFGGSTTEGTCDNSTYFATLPDPQTIEDLSTFFVTWRKTRNSVSPAAREMHSTSHQGRHHVFISGGVSQHCADGFSDVWRLTARVQDQGEVGIQWERCRGLELPMTLYAHCSNISVSSSGRVLYAVMSGLSGGGGNTCLVEDLLCADITDRSVIVGESSSSVWGIAQFSPARPVGFRLGMCFLSGVVPQWIQKRFAPADPPMSKSAKRNARKKKARAARAAAASADKSAEEPVQSDGTAQEPDPEAVEEEEGGREEAGLAEEVPSGVNQSASSSTSNAILLFGGMDQAREYNDMWLLTCDPSMQGSLSQHGQATVSASETGNGGLVSVLA